MYIRVTVAPDSKKDHIVKEATDRFKISVRAPAERNLANKAACDLMASYFKIAVKSIKIISGHHSVRKILSIDLPDKKVI